MATYSNANEGYRLLDEFVCQAVPDPASAEEGLIRSRGQNEGLDVSEAMTSRHELEVVLGDPTSLSDSLVGEGGRLKHSIHIADGVSLSPLFPSLQCAAAAGGNDVLAFVINIPVRIATHFVAAALYKWVIKHGIRRMRANGIEVPVGASQETVRAITEALNEKGKKGKAEELR